MILFLIVFFFKNNKHARGETAQALLEQSPVRLIQFTGSSAVANKLAKIFGGRVKLEDAGYDWQVEIN